MTHSLTVFTLLGGIGAGQALHFASATPTIESLLVGGGFAGLAIYLVLVLVNRLMPAIDRLSEAVETMKQAVEKQQPVIAQVERDLTESVKVKKALIDNILELTKEVKSLTAKGLK